MIRRTRTRSEHQNAVYQNFFKQRNGHGMPAPRGAGQSVDQFVKEWTTPAKYKGYLARQRAGPTSHRRI